MKGLLYRMTGILCGLARLYQATSFDWGNEGTDLLRWPWPHYFGRFSGTLVKLTSMLFTDTIDAKRQT
jgi:hypothetical protein